MRSTLVTVFILICSLLELCRAQPFYANCQSVWMYELTMKPSDFTAMKADPWGTGLYNFSGKMTLLNPATAKNAATPSTNIRYAMISMFFYLVVFKIVIAFLVDSISFSRLVLLR
jgi:hypothetical protein